MNRLLFATFPFLLLVGLWWLVVIALEVPHFILPSPERVARVLVERLPLISGHAFTTASEIVCGLTLGTVLGFAVACLIGDSKKLTQITMPALIISQALPVFAIAPILMLWLGYGFASKLAMTTLHRFFPCNCQYACGLSRDVEVMGTDISNIAPETLATILVCSVAPRDPLCTLRSSSGKHQLRQSARLWVSGLARRADSDT